MHPCRRFGEGETRHPGRGPRNLKGHSFGLRDGKIGGLYVQRLRYEMQIPTCCERNVGDELPVDHGCSFNAKVRRRRGAKKTGEEMRKKTKSTKPFLSPFPPSRLCAFATLR